MSSPTHRAMERYTKMDIQSGTTYLRQQHSKGEGGVGDRAAEQWARHVGGSWVGRVSFPARHHHASAFDVFRHARGVMASKPRSVIRYCAYFRTATS